MRSFLFVGILLCVVGISRAVNVAKCRNGTATKLTLTPSDDGIAGRYVAELCDAVKPDFITWKLMLYVYDNENKCNSSKSYSKPKSHSEYEEAFTNDGNCSYVCLSTTFDLVYKSCYSLQSLFVTKDNSIGKTKIKYFNINTTYTMDYINTNKVYVIVNQIDKENVIVEWHTGVPFKSFKFEVYNVDSISNKTEKEPIITTNECGSVASTELRCGAALNRSGCYQLELYLDDWVGHEALRDKSYNKHIYCPRATTPESAESAAEGARWWLWAASGAGAACAACGAAAVLCAARRRALHKRVLGDWLMRRSESVQEAGGGAVKPAAAAQRHVLLLYAREGPAAARLIACLRDVLQAPHTQVHDIFSAEVTAAAAAAPGAWVRGMLQRDDVAVLLLQTPALAALYRAQPPPPPPPPADHAAHDLALGSPLLGRRVLYRAPQYGDVLLQYAVRLAAEAAHAHSDYHKYYIATLAALPTEAVPALVPFRRYVLPGAGALLARDAARAAPPAAALAALAAAAAEFADTAAARPHYLLDELVLL